MRPRRAPSALTRDPGAPDDASAYTHRWTSKGFDQLVQGSTLGVITLPGWPAFKAHHVRRLLPVGGKAGVDGAIGVMGSPFTGIEAATGVWWSYPSSAIVSITFGGSAGKPTVKQLNEIASVAVEAFGLAPLTLRAK